MAKKLGKQEESLGLQILLSSSNAMFVLDESTLSPHPLSTYDPEVAAKWRGFPCLGRGEIGV